MYECIVICNLINFGVWEAFLINYLESVPRVCDTKPALCFIPRQLHTANLHRLCMQYSLRAARLAGSPPREFAFSILCLPAGGQGARRAPSSPRAPITGCPASPCRRQTWCAAQLRARSLKLAPGGKRGAHRCKEIPPSTGLLTSGLRPANLVSRVRPSVSSEAGSSSARDPVQQLTCIDHEGINNRTGISESERHFYETAP